MSSTAGPKFTFVSDDGTEIVFDFAREGAKVEATAEILRQKHLSGPNVGLLYRSEPNLLISWLACISAGLKPLVLQYPTRKQTRAYWSESIQNTYQQVGLSAIIADSYCAEILGSYDQSDVFELEPATMGEIAEEKEIRPVRLPQEFAIVQLSSGTTGFRKAIEFTSAHLDRHVRDYNEALQLTSADKIVSWLPLYHDMGYVACFVMPMLLGIDVVMMDPITWVANPQLLFDAIERHGTTVCYMPNFGFEVMTRSKPRPTPTMRYWISCSEPVSRTTSLKFLRAIEAEESVFGPCYAMAENIFAVSIGQGCGTAVIDGAEVVSCGKPIPGVEVKIVDGEIWVRSPTSLESYLAGNDIRDAEGFYPTGDLGALIGGELFISGRKQDLLIQAGRKFILSDIDLRLNEMFPEVKGRAATVALRDERVGTETPLVLIEGHDFFTRADSAQIAQSLKQATGLDQADVSFVPPRFITKTSSGKINRRKSRSDWQAVRAAADDRRGMSRDRSAELRNSFSSADWDRPIQEALDSLSRTVLQTILEGSGVDFEGTSTLRAVSDALVRSAAANDSQGDAPAEGIRIVSLANRLTLRNIRESHLDRLSDMLGCPVSLEHVCLPPSPVLLSDLIFHDYFQPRLDGSNFGAVNYILEKVKGASMLLVDDVAELAFLYESVYPALSHNIERDPRADLISFRWQQYTRGHDSLPLAVVAGVDIPLMTTNHTLAELGRYLGVPIFRTGLISGFGRITEGWDYHAFGSHLAGVDPDSLVDRLVAWIGALPDALRRRPMPGNLKLAMSDLGHFCSHMANRQAVDMVLDKFDSFCIAGERSSMPYVRRRLDLLDKPYVHVASHSPEILAQVTANFDCLILCGTVGRYEGAVPMIAFQHADAPARTAHMGDLAEALPALNEIPKSGHDWFYTFDFQRRVDYEEWSAARREMTQIVQQAQRRGLAVD